MDQCADKIEISGNTTFTGPSLSARTAGASGLELWGRSITVTGNNITGYPSEGIGVNSGFDVTISGNSIQNNNTRADPLGGISAQTAEPGVCDPIPRDTQTLSISGNVVSGQYFGIQFGDRSPNSRNTLNSVAIAGNNSLSGSSGFNIWQDPVVALTNYTDSGLGTSVGPVLDTLPRALPIDAVSPVTKRCPSTGSRRQTFKFSAAQVTGANNLQSIQGVFSIGGNDEDGSGGPSCPPGQPNCPYCFFYYDVPSNRLYLDDQQATTTWPYSSIIGAGGSALSNSYCTIYTASSSVQAESKVFSLNLDVEFLTYLSTLKHMYVVVQNTSLQVSPGDQGQQWKYWGWWSTP